MLIIDRFEKDFAIIEDHGNFFSIPKKQISFPVKEGDVLYCKKNFYYKDEKATLLRKSKIASLEEDLWQN